MVRRGCDGGDTPTNGGWIIINVGGAPTDDKPTVTLETPREPDRVSSLLNIRVKDIHAVYAEWSARGAPGSPGRPGSYFVIKGWALSS
jgi:hypothetical protein